MLTRGFVWFWLLSSSLIDFEWDLIEDKLEMDRSEVVHVTIVTRFALIFCTFTLVLELHFFILEGLLKLLLLLIHLHRHSLTADHISNTAKYLLTFQIAQILRFWLRFLFFYLHGLVLEFHCLWFWCICNILWHSMYFSINSCRLVILIIVFHELTTSFLIKWRLRERHDQ